METPSVWTQNRKPMFSDWTQLKIGCCIQKKKICGSCFILVTSFSVVNRSIRGIELSDGSHCRLEFPETDTISSHSFFLLCPLKTRE